MTTNEPTTVTLADILEAVSGVSRQVEELTNRLQTIEQRLEVIETEAEAQAWYWSPEWQAAEQEADEELDRGEYDEFETVEAFVDSLSPTGYEALSSTGHEAL